MSRTTINSLGIPADTIVSADLDYPLTDFSSTGIDDNATSIALVIDSSNNVTVNDSTGASVLRVTSSDSSSAYLQFGDQSNGAVSSVQHDNSDNSVRINNNGAERMRIDAGGRVCIGTASADPITNKSTGCMLNLGVVNAYSNTSTSLNLGRANNGVMVQFWINGANASGGISTTQGGTPTFFASSDERLKENIVEHESELANVMSLRPTRWDWKKDEQGSGEGFIAQDLEQTAWSDLVAEGADGYKTVAGLGIVETRLIKALQEAVAKIEDLESRMSAVEAN